MTDDADQPVSQSQQVEDFLRKMAPGLPGSVKFRMLNTFEHFRRASSLLEVDKEMASFRAITGEEEAATFLIKALQLRRYPNAKRFNARSHQHKVAVKVCVAAVATELQPLLREFEVKFNFEKRRIDVKIPLSNFGVAGDEAYLIEPVEPLDFSRHHHESNQIDPLCATLQLFATKANFENIKRMIAEVSNGRNTLLYASDSGLPASRTTAAIIERRKSDAFVLLAIGIMILQSSKHLAMVLQTSEAFLGIIGKLPPE